MGQQAAGLAGAAQVRGEGVDIDGVGQVQVGVVLDMFHQGLRRARGLLLTQRDGTGEYCGRERPWHPGIPWRLPGGGPQSHRPGTPWR